MIDDAMRDAEELGAPFAIRVRKGRTPEVEEAARQLGFAVAEQVPGMLAGPVLRKEVLCLREIAFQERLDGVLEVLRAEEGPGDLADALVGAAHPMLQEGPDHALGGGVGERRLNGRDT